MIEDQKKVAQEYLKEVLGVLDPHFVDDECAPEFVMPFVLNQTLGVDLMERPNANLEYKQLTEDEVRDRCNEALAQLAMRYLEFWGRLQEKLKKKD